MDAVTFTTARLTLRQLSIDDLHVYFLSKKFINYKIYRDKSLNRYHRLLIALLLCLAKPKINENERFNSDVEETAITKPNLKSALTAGN